MNLRRTLMMLVAAALLAACAQPSGVPAPGPGVAPAPSGLPEPLPPPPFEEAVPARTVVPEVDYRCTVDADCAVKNVGNCCGAMPACVNKDARPDPAAVQAQCARQGMSSICGFKEVTGCSCVAGTCQDQSGAIAQ